MIAGIDFISLVQQPPFSAGKARVLGQFTVLGNMPDFIQIYALPGFFQSQPGSPFSKIDTISPKSPDPTQTFVLEDLVPGQVYTVWVCPRTGTEEEPEDQTDGVDWVSACVFRTIAVRGVDNVSGAMEPPRITSIGDTPATMFAAQRMTLNWIVDNGRTYNKFLIHWYRNGQEQPQIEIDAASGGSAQGSWSATVAPFDQFRFAVKGGLYRGLSGFDYTAWGAEVAFTCPQNSRSVKAYILSSVAPSRPLPLRNFMGSTKSVRSFMKLG